MITRNRGAQRSDSTCVGRIGVGAVGEQKCHGFFPIVKCCEQQRGAARIITRVDIGRLVETALQLLEIAGLGRQKQCVRRACLSRCLARAD